MEVKMTKCLKCVNYNVNNDSCDKTLATVGGKSMNIDCALFSEEVFYENDPYDNVHHPKHYTEGKYECIDVMEEVFGKAAVMDFCACNAFKYLYRCNKKHNSPVEDVKKAIWYLNKFVELEEK